MGLDAEGRIEGNCDSEWSHACATWCVADKSIFFRCCESAVATDAINTLAAMKSGATTRRVKATAARKTSSMSSTRCSWASFSRGSSARGTWGSARCVSVSVGLLTSQPRGSVLLGPLRGHSGAQVYRDEGFIRQAGY